MRMLNLMLCMTLKDWGSNKTNLVAAHSIPQITAQNG